MLKALSRNSVQSVQNYRVRTAPLHGKSTTVVALPDAPARAAIAEACWQRARQSYEHLQSDRQHAPLAITAASQGGIHNNKGTHQQWPTSTGQILKKVVHALASGGVAGSSLDTPSSLAGSAGGLDMSIAATSCITE